MSRFMRGLGALVDCCRRLTIECLAEDIVVQLPSAVTALAAATASAVMSWSLGGSSR